VGLFAKEYGEGPPLVLLPWFGLDHSVMAAACEPALAGSGWRRMYLDLPGTGNSDPVEPRSDAVADAIVSTVNDLAGESSVAVVGCSYGGYLACAMAQRDPGRVAGVLMVCSSVRILPGDRDLAGVLPSTPEPGWLHDVPEQLREHFDLAVGCQTKAAADRLTAALEQNGPSDRQYLKMLRTTGYQVADERSMLAVALMPTATIIAGRRDRIVGYRDQFDLAARSRSADYACLDDAGHYLPFEQPARFRTLALDWLARCHPSRRSR
jgi:pimeloyl-ACP methyl ester carboxylesterase